MTPEPGTSRDQQQNRLSLHEEIQQRQEQARTHTNELILEAERRKAALIPPSGMDVTTSFGTFATVPAVDVNFNDDDASNFCQVTAHIDNNTMYKIARGQLLDLDKLTPKEVTKVYDKSDNQIEFVNKDGKTYFVPCAEKESAKISGVRGWEKAFRVYAAIYTRFNPHRGAEIYQYVHSINLAAASYSWDNVAYYDFQFRKIMSDNPQRSWAKVHTQLWSLAMRDAKPTDKSSTARNTNNNAKRGSFDKDSVCWRFNRNQCKKQNCKFEHRCSFVCKL